MPHQTITTFTCNGSFPVLLEQDEKNGQSFRVTYGDDVQRGLGMIAAAHAYGECVLHALACAGRVDQVDGDDVCDALELS